MIVVCASYTSLTAALIYSGKSVSFREGALLVALGTAYLVVGTYGFAQCRRSRSVLAAPAYFVVQLALAAILIILRGSSGELSLILLPLAGQSALLLPLPWMIPVCALIYLTLVIPFIQRSRWIDALAIASIYGTGIVFVIVFTRVAAAERQARAELAEANQRLRERAAQIEELATTKERNRLAREIHDSLGHYLTVVNVQISAAQAVMEHDRPRALDHLGKAQILAKEGLADVRRSVATLRASPIEGRPLVEALTELSKQWDSPGLRTRFFADGTIRPLAPHANLTLYRTAEEALTNVGKHAHATTVELRLEYRENLVRLRVSDNGVGSGKSEGGFGLLGVRERVLLLNGEVRIRRNEGGGFVLEVELPA